MTTVESTMVALGTPAPSFALPDVDGNLVTLDDITASRAMLVMFLSNHCPYVRHIESELASMVAEYQPMGVEPVAICSNDTSVSPDDAAPKLREQAERAGFTFPYLIDESQEVAMAYGASCTPDFFLYDVERILTYRGEFDDARPGNDIPVTGVALRDALDMVLSGQSVPEPQKASMGCNIKWSPDRERSA